MSVRNVLIALLAVACGAVVIQRLHADAPPAPAHAATTVPTTLPTVELRIGTERFTLEVADDPDEQATGLMHRPSMPADRGMLFVFPWSAPRSFWMRNTLIPLDIIYLDDDARVLNVEPMVPHDETGVRSDGKARYAIELNAGTARRVGVKRGDAIALPVLPR